MHTCSAHQVTEEDSCCAAYLMIALSRHGRAQEQAEKPEEGPGLREAQRLPSHRQACLLALSSNPYWPHTTLMHTPVPQSPTLCLSP